ncbi:MAG: hypothetical protein JWR42_1910, partial [Marmoricola sp.]|nr:hypothetical protein [Marmoricola sp.]
MSWVRRAIVGSAVALTLAGGLVGAGAGSGSGAASAASCSGVNVVLDRHGLGGGVRQACDPAGSGQPASVVFGHAGFQLSYAQREPGFVCRVNGAPSSDPCVNTSPSNAYWGLYWSNGTSGTWNYASTGVGGLKVPKGGWVAFSWQNGGSADPPGVTPRSAAPAPSKAPSSGPSKAPGKAPSKAPSKAPATAPSKAPGTTATRPPAGFAGSASAP